MCRKYQTLDCADDDDSTDGDWLEGKAKGHSRGKSLDLNKMISGRDGKCAGVCVWGCYTCISPNSFKGPSIGGTPQTSTGKATEYLCVLSFSQYHSDHTHHLHWNTPPR